MKTTEPKPRLVNPVPIFAQMKAEGFEFDHIRQEGGGSIQMLEEDWSRFLQRYNELAEQQRDALSE